ncbi:hypothetical protein COOONC_11219 [Cooperia oncophora]
MRPNPLHITFKNPNWPANFITPENVLEYFCNSDNAFYDKASCNENVRMQNISRPLEECLLSMTGIQYVLWSAQPPLYVICKHRRNNMQNDIMLRRVTTGSSTRSLLSKKEDEKSEEEQPLQARSTHFQKTRTHMLMQNLFEMFPAGNAVAISDPPEKSEPMDTEEKPETNGDVAAQQTEETTQAPSTSAAKSK